MKQSFIIALTTLSLVVTVLFSANAQAPPGWGWVNRLGTFVPNTTSQNDVAGLGRDAAGNLYLLGTVAGPAPFLGAPAGSAGGSDIFLAKYGPTGTLLWQRTLQSSSNDKALALVVEPSGRCTLAGYYSGETGDNLSFASFNNTTPPLAGAALLGLATTGGRYGALTFVAAVDANGSLLWADIPSPVYGGVNVAALHRDSNGNCYVSANTNPQGALAVNGQNFPPIGSVDAVLLKYTAAGQVAWARRVGANGGFTYSGEVKTDAANAVYWNINHNHNLLIDSRAISFVAPANPVTQGSNSLVKLTATNSVRWVKNNLLKAGATNAQGTVVAIDQASGTLYLTGGSYGGTMTDEANTMAVPVPAGSLGTCIARCDTSGLVQWVRPFAYASTVPGGANWAAMGIVNVFPDAAGYSVLTNTAYAAQTVFPPSNTFDFNKNGLPCVARFDYVTNQFSWIRTGGVVGNYNNGSSLGSNAIASTVDAAGNVFVAGTFTGTAQFGTTAITSTSTSQPEIFLAKLDQTILTASKPATAGATWSVYPNPAAGTAQLAGLPATAQVRVYDAQGRLVRALPAVATADAPRTLSGLAPGLYLLQVTNTQSSYQSKRLVME